MGIVLDTSVLVAHERSRLSVDDLITGMGLKYPKQNLAISAMTIAELTHGVFRANSSAIAERRQTFINDLCRDVFVEPVSVALARLIGRIEGEQAAKGLSIDLADLIIGATAVHLNATLLTLNPKHFTPIPDLVVQTL